MLSHPLSHPLPPTHSPPHHTPTNAKIHILAGDHLVFVPNSRLPILRQAAGPLADNIDDPALTDFLTLFLAEHGNIAWAYSPPPDAPSAIQAQGYCATIAIQHTTSRSSGPPRSLTNLSMRQDCHDMLSRLHSDPRLHPTYKLLAATRAHILTAPTLPPSLWPRLPQAATWANAIHPTAFWDYSDNLTTPWLQLSITPESSLHTPSTAPTWTTPQLAHAINSPSIALANAHYFPISPSPSIFTQLTKQLIAQLADYITQDRYRRQLSIQAHPNNSTAPSTLPTPPTPTRVHFHPTSTRAAEDQPLTITNHPPPPPLIHPALRPTCPQYPTIPPPPRHPRAASNQSHAPVTLPPRPNTTYYTLASQAKHLDAIMIGPATTPGSRWGAYARRPITEEGELLGKYTSHRPTEITHPSDHPYSGDYICQRLRPNNTYLTVDAAHFDSCHGRFIDEAMTEAEENCMFTLHKNQIWVKSTRPIQACEQLLTRYGYIYWCDTRWPLPLLLAMRDKYKPVSTQTQKLQWQATIEAKKRALLQLATAHHPSCLKLPPPSPPPATTTPPRLDPTRHSLNTTSARAAAAQAELDLQAQTRKRHHRASKKANRRTQRYQPLPLVHRAANPKPQSRATTSTPNLLPDLHPPVPPPPPQPPPLLTPPVSHHPTQSSPNHPHSRSPPPHDNGPATHPLHTIPQSHTPLTTAPTPTDTPHHHTPYHHPHHSNSPPPLDPSPTHTLNLHSPPTPSTPTPTYIHHPPNRTPTDTQSPLLPHHWIHTLIPCTTTTNSLTTMSWNSQGHLYSAGNSLVSQVKQFLFHVSSLILEHHVDVGWITDGHNIKDAITEFLPLIQTILPDCHIIQFPTTVVKTNSPNKSNERMGGAIAIVSYRWKGFITKTKTDPTKAGILNYIDFKRGPYSFRIINAYLPPSTNGDGPATITARVNRHQHTTKALATWQRQQSPYDYLLDLLQTWITEARLTDSTVLVCGDMNTDLTASTIPARTFRQWLYNNHLHAPFQSTLHTLPDYHTWHDTTNGTTIDHILHTPLPHNVHTAQHATLNDNATRTWSDHLPILIRFHLSDPLTAVPKCKPTPLPLRIEIDYADEHGERQHFADGLDLEINTTLPTLLRKFDYFTSPPLDPELSSKCVAAIQRMGVQVATEHPDIAKGKKQRLKQKGGKLQSSFKNGYSPQMRLLQIHLYYYTDLIRRAFPTRPHPRLAPWTTLTYQSILTQGLKQWTERHTKILTTTSLPPNALHIPHPSHLHHKPFHLISLAYLKHLRKQVKDELHGTKRTQYRAAQNSTIRSLDTMRANKEIGPSIERLACQPRVQVTLQTLPCPIKGQIVDPHQISDKLKDYFTDWYSSPSSLDPAARALDSDPSFWKSLLHYDSTQPLPQPLHPNSSIPLPLQDGLRRACASKLSPDTTARIEDVLQAPVTFQDFTDAIQDVKTNGAPGPSDHTANMLKAWSLETTTIVYNHMCNIWGNRLSPSWFKDKTVKLAPKIPGNTDLKNMRPISLYEVIRKVWTTILAKRINLIWHQEGALHAAQSGYRLDHGTYMALFNVINEVEDANHTKTTKHATFWDIRRAFDSIPRNLQRLAWTRLGIPHDIAEWFVSLDDGGLSFITSPLFLTTRNQKTPADLMENAEHMCHNTDTSFTAHRGIGQGESASSLLWIAMYDILLEWIDHTNLTLHTAEDLPAQPGYTAAGAKKSNPQAYADDLNTMTAGPNARYMQQLQATWLSAFCAFTGMEMHPDKIHATTLGPPPPTPPPPLYIYDSAWTPIPITVNPTLTSVKYLGVHLDLRDNAISSHAALLADIECRISHLLLQAASPEVKIDFIRNKILPIALYSAICANWTLAEHRALDAPFTTAYKRILSHPRTYPTALLYLPKKFCGNGLPRLSDRAQIMKWESFQRSIAVGGKAEEAINQLLERVPHHHLSTTTPIQTLSAKQWSPTHRYTARSLIEWAKESGISLARRAYTTRSEHEANEANHSALAACATFNQLWPDTELWGEDQELPHFTAFFTDGSFKPQEATTNDILSSDQHLRDNGSGGGGIVFLPTFTTDDPVLIRITSSKPEPGMNAYHWELATQLVALHLAKHLPPHVPGFTDCKGAMARTNRATTTTNDQLSRTRGGIFSSAIHLLANPIHPRRFHWVKSHPELDPLRRALTCRKALGIFIADCLAEGNTAALRKRNIPDNFQHLNLTELLNEIIPPGLWHMRSMAETPTPILDDLAHHQHQAQLTTYLAKRDAGKDTPKWTIANMEFAHRVHPLPNKSFWAAARRTSVIYDKLGHGRNKAKRAAAHEKETASKCPHCQAQDSQMHCMLDCPHPPFTEIRERAQLTQIHTAYNLLAKHSNNNIQVFIHHLLCDSWIPSPNIDRIWLGTWTSETLNQLTRQPLTQRMSSANRYTYIAIARKMLAPLQQAYRELIKSTISSAERNFPLRDSAPTPPTPHTQLIACNMPTSNLPHTIPSHTSSLTYTDYIEIEALHQQLIPTRYTPLLLSIARVASPDTYTISDSAHRLLPPVQEDG